MPGLEIRERQFDYGPQRASWISMVLVRDLRDAADTQLEYHERRLNVWKVRLARATKKEMASMKAVQQQVTGGVQTMYQTDLLASQQKQLAQLKVEEHQRRVDEFREWMNIFQYDLDKNHAEDHKVPCTIADLEYFKLSGYTPPER